MATRVHSLLVCGALSWPVVMAGCADESSEAAADRIAFDLLRDVQANGYTDWATMPGFEAPVASTGPHGQTVSVYTNRILADALGAGPEWPVGSVVVKDGYADDALLVRSIMRKEEAGWFYALFDADDRLVASGAGAYCVDCHDNGRDQLLTAPVPLPED